MSLNNNTTCFFKQHPSTFYVFKHHHSHSSSKFLFQTTSSNFLSFQTTSWSFKLQVASSNNILSPSLAWTCCFATFLVAKTIQVVCLIAKITFRSSGVANYQSNFKILINLSSKKMVVSIQTLPRLLKKSLLARKIKSLI